MTFHQNQHPQNFYDPIINNTIEKLFSSKENQRNQVKKVKSQKSSCQKM